MKWSALLLAIVALAACGSGSDVDASTTSQPTASTGASSAFPVTVEVAGEPLIVEQPPQRIISLSPTATETLFAIGAGDQIVAVDEFSTFPDDAPTTDLSGFTPNIEALAEFDPDMIVISFDPEEMITSAFVPRGVTVVRHFPATDRADMLGQIEQLGALTGHLAEAVALSGEIADRWDAAVGSDARGASVYIEVDPTFFSASSASFMGAPLADLGYTNIADDADPDGFGFPQLSAEAILDASPDVIVVGTDAGTTEADVAGRPGWDSIAAVSNDRVVVVDSDLASRWGPRFVQYIEIMADLADELVGADT